MKILYGVQGTGNGHINRSREIISKLRKDHSVQVILSGRDPDKFFDIDDLKPYSVYDGITFQTKSGEVDYIETIKNLKINKFYKNVFEYEEDHDLVITDFEPITSRIARKKKIPSIGLAHQYCSVTDAVSDFIVKKFAPADIELGTHWWHFNRNIVPPILPESLYTDIDNGDKIVVYLPWLNLDQIVKQLNRLYSEFVLFHPVKYRQQLGNVVVHPLSRRDFLRELKRSAGVISNAGFQLSSEALALGKKLFVVPIKKQPEQLSNAEVLRLLNLGMSDTDLRSDGLIQYWLQLPNRKQLEFPNVSRAFVDWINEGRLSVKDLLTEVW